MESILHVIVQSAKALAQFVLLWLLGAVATVLFVSCTPLPTIGMHTINHPSPSPSPVKTATTLVASADIDICTVAVPNLNLRREAGTSAPVEDVLSNGDVVSIDQETPAQGNWQRVFHGDLAGWVNMNYCKKQQ